MKKLQEKWKGSGIDMTTFLWHKICEKSYKKNEKVAEYIWRQSCDTKFVKKLQEKWKGSGIDMTKILWHKICEKVTRKMKR